MTEPQHTQARLIPVSGIGSVQEAEQRATSGFLAVLSVVRDLSIELLSPMGASRARKAEVKTFIEVKMPKSNVRPDGLIQVQFGKVPWSAFVEVKTGSSNLTADQINAYWDLAREFDVDHIITISNEIAPSAGVHPTPGLKVKANSKVQVSHISWSAIVSAAIRIKQHKGIDDPEQAWLLAELIRYLEHSSSGALDFSDMGGHWVAVRDAAREATLSKRTEGIDEVVARWDQLLRFGALKLSALIGDDVDTIYPRGQTDLRTRRVALVESLSTTGTLSGGLRIPNTAGDLIIDADIRARQLAASISVTAPQDKGARGRVTWLINQLSDAPGDIVIEAYARNARTGTAMPLSQVREERAVSLDGDHKEPHRFRVVMRAEMGLGRKTGTRSSDFVSSVLNLTNKFYGDVIQHITAWQPPAPKLKQAPKVESLDDEDDTDVEPSPGLTGSSTWTPSRFDSSDWSRD